MHNPGTFDWNDLRHFLAVARDGSTLAAARTLGVNQSTVHRRLAELEKRLGCMLVERHPSGYRLTEYGKDLLPYAERVEEQANALRRRVATFDRAMRGSIRLTCSTTVVHRLMTSRFLDAFHARFPEVKVELLMTERLLDISKGEADVAIRGGDPKEANLVGRKIADVPWGIYASRAYLERRGRPKRPEDADTHSVIEFIGEIANLKAAGWLRIRAPLATVSGQSSNVPSVLMAVKAGVGLAPLPVPLAERDAELVCVFGPVAELNYPTFLVTHRELRKIPRISAFFGFCQTQLRSILLGVECAKLRSNASKST